MKFIYPDYSYTIVCFARKLVPIKRKILQRHPFSFLLRYCHEKANPHSLLLIRKMSVLTLTRAT